MKKAIWIYIEEERLIRSKSKTKTFPLAAIKSKFLLWENKKKYSLPSHSTNPKWVTQIVLKWKNTTNSVRRKR